MLTFRHVPAEDSMVDDAYELYDGEKDTGISIQDCSSYAGCFSVTQSFGEGHDFALREIGERRTLAAAKALALKTHR